MSLKLKLLLAGVLVGLAVALSGLHSSRATALTPPSLPPPYTAAAVAPCPGGGFFFFPHWYEYLNCDNNVTPPSPEFSFPGDLLPVALAAIHILMRLAGLVAIF